MPLDRPARLLVSAAASLFLLCISVVAGNARDLGPVGGGGGIPNDYRCKEGDALVGISIWHRAGAVSSISAVCAYLDDERKRWSAPTTYSRGPAGDGGGTHELLACKRHEAIMSAVVAAGNADTFFVMTGLAIYCAKLTDQNQWYKIDSKFSGDTRTNKDLGCHLTDDVWATGIFGGAALFVDRMGVHCGLKPAAGGSDAECNGYGDRMAGMVNEGVRLGCAFVSGSGGWGNNDRAYWVRQCKKKDGASLMSYNEPALKGHLDKCKSGGGGGGLTVIDGVTMYDSFNDGNEVCFLFAGDKVTKLSSQGAEAPWGRFNGASGNCQGKSGFVYNDGKIR